MSDVDFVIPCMSASLDPYLDPGVSHPETMLRAQMAPCHPDSHNLVVCPRADGLGILTLEMRYCLSPHRTPHLLFGGP